MMMKNRFLFLSMLFLLSSCLAVGVPYTNNPSKLLSYAMQMSLDGRPFRMKQFIDRSYELSSRSGDQEGIADAYRFYGKYYRYHGEHRTIDNGPNIVPIQAQQKKSLDYYLKALDIYVREQIWHSAAVAAVEVGQGYDILDDPRKANFYFDEASSYYDNFLKMNSKAEFPYASQYDDFFKLIEYERSLVGKK